MTLKETLAKLKALGNEKVRAQNKKQGAGDNQYGVRHGDIRKLAAKIKTDHTLAIGLWETGNIDAQFLAILIMNPKNLSANDIDRMVRAVNFAHVADWFISYIIKIHPDKESLRQRWMKSDDPWAARAGWSLTPSGSVRVLKDSTCRLFSIASNPKCRMPLLKFNGR